MKCHEFRQLPWFFRYQHGWRASSMRMTFAKSLHVCQLICEKSQSNFHLPGKNRFEIMLNKPPYQWAILALVRGKQHLKLHTRFKFSRRMIAWKNLFKKSSRFHNLRFLAAASLGMFHLSCKVGRFGESLWGGLELVTPWIRWDQLQLAERKWTEYTIQRILSCRIHCIPWTRSNTHYIKTWYSATRKFFWWIPITNHDQHLYTYIYIHIWYVRYVLQLEGCSGSFEL